jgi:hypothetical protein
MYIGPIEELQTVRAITNNSESKFRRIKTWGGGIQVKFVQEKSAKYSSLFVLITVPFVWNKREHCIKKRRV